MQIVIDANIIFSALIKNGVTKRLISEPSLSLFTPKLLIEEFIKHLWELKQKTNSDEDMLKERLDGYLIRNIKLIPSEDLNNFIPEAQSICPDIGDVAYFALALKLNCPIWSNDKALKKQTRVNIISTEELINLIYS